MEFINIIIWQLGLLYLIWYKINIIDRLTEVEPENIYNKIWLIW